MATVVTEWMHSKQVYKDPRPHPKYVTPEIPWSAVLKTPRTLNETSKWNGEDLY